MERSELTAKLTPIFHSIFTDDSIVIVDSMTAADVAKWDSLSYMNMIMAVEKAFNVQFTVKQIRSFKNVGDLIDVIKQKIG
jgi:acyl carrier protein